tara:strand:+ start:42636 stop:43742 length:1107 start_codon:yes stop_codon:yes gene_type:complete
MSIDPIQSSSAQAGSRRGSAGLWLVLLALVAVGAVLFLKFSGSGAGPGPIDPVGPAGPVVPDPGPDSDPSELEGMSTQGRVEVGAATDLRDYTKTFDGTGTISGVLDIPDTLRAKLPKTWELVISPSRMALGRDSAGSRVKTMDINQTTFEERDLPMGGYRVTARAEGLNATGHEVMLFGLKEAPNNGVSHVHVVMQLRPSGFARGSVLDSLGSPAEGVQVTIGEVEGTKRWRTTTGIDGWWRIDELLDGRYRVWIGPPTQPFVPEFPMAVVSPSVTVDEVKLPAMGSIILWVTDGQGRPLEEVRVRGYGASPIDVVTGFEGRVAVPHLRPGMYHVEVEAGATQHTGRLSFEVLTTDRDKVVQINAKD